MERRRSKRLAINMSAKVIANGKSYDGIIGNISEEGLAYTITTFIQADKGFIPRGTVELIINIPSGRTLQLKCEVRWFLKPSPDGKALIMGMQIAEPVSKYMDWIKEIKSRQDSISGTLT